jgi:hypothetical protein
MCPVPGSLDDDEPTPQKFFRHVTPVLLLFHLADTLSLYQHRIPTLYVTILLRAFIYYLSSSLS